MLGDAVYCTYEHLLIYADMAKRPALSDASALALADTFKVLGDPTRIQSELGWLPEIPLDRTLDDVLEDWRRRANA